jgi:hypothetical protein
MRTIAKGSPHGARLEADHLGELAERQIELPEVAALEELEIEPEGARRTVLEERLTCPLVLDVDPKVGGEAREIVVETEAPAPRINARPSRLSRRNLLGRRPVRPYERESPLRERLLVCPHEIEDTLAKSRMEVG